MYIRIRNGTISLLPCRVPDLSLYCFIINLETSATIASTCIHLIVYLVIAEFFNYTKAEYKPGSKFNANSALALHVELIARET